MPHASDEYDERKVSVLGFVTAREVKPKYVGLLIEDETGFVTVKVASKKMNRLGPVFRELKLGDLVVVAGWWSGDTLYADSRTMVLPSLLRSAKEKK
jgi:aspartyl/asparaginyl-tRNA synthetase